MPHAPRVSTPQFKSFSEMECVNLVAEVAHVGGSASKFSDQSKLFPGGPMVELFIFSGFFIIWTTSKWGEVQKELGDQEDSDTPERWSSLLY